MDSTPARERGQSAGSTATTRSHQLTAVAAAGCWWLRRASKDKPPCLHVGPANGDIVGATLAR